MKVVTVKVVATVKGRNCKVRNAKKVFFKVKVCPNGGEVWASHNGKVVVSQNDAVVISWIWTPTIPFDLELRKKDF